MLTGVKCLVFLTREQKMIISRWFGCYRFIWNAKCEEEKYQRSFAKRYLPIGTYPKVDQTFSQYKNKELSPWLFLVPSQLLRNSVTNWHKTYKNFLKGLCGKPICKRKTTYDSIHLTRELFSFEKCLDGNIRLFIGTKTNNIGYIVIKKHKKFKEPNSLYLKRHNGRFYIAFCYEDNLETISQKDYLKNIQDLSFQKLDEMVVGIDRGVIRPIQAGDDFFNFNDKQKRKKRAKEKYIKKCQRKMNRQQKGSKKREKTKLKISKSHEKIGNIRKDFCHKTTRSLVDKKEHQIFILEDLKTKNMTKKPKAKKDEKGKYIKNNRKQKAGLNRSILDNGWNLFETFLKYKAVKAKKMWYKVLANHTSQECAECGHIHPQNRRSQTDFCCLSCGHIDNADRNAARVIKKRALKLLLYSGTELSSRGVLLDIERGAINKTQRAKANCAKSNEALKKKEKASLVSA